MSDVSGFGCTDGSTVNVTLLDNFLTLLRYRSSSVLYSFYMHLHQYFTLYTFI